MALLLPMQEHKRQRSRVQYPVRPHTFVSPSTDSRRAVVSYWRKYVHGVLVIGLGSLPRKSVVRLTDRPNMTINVYCGHKTTTQQHQQPMQGGIISLKKHLVSISPYCFIIGFWHPVCKNICRKSLKIENVQICKEYIQVRWLIMSHLTWIYTACCLIRIHKMIS